MVMVLLRAGGAIWGGSAPGSADGETGGFGADGATAEAAESTDVAGEPEELEADGECGFAGGVASLAANRCGVLRADRGRLGSIAKTPWSGRVMMTVSPASLTMPCFGQNFDQRHLAVGRIDHRMADGPDDGNGLALLSRTTTLTSA